MDKCIDVAASIRSYIQPFQRTRRSPGEQLPGDAVDFSSSWPVKIAKMELFSTFTENINFAKNVVFHVKNCYFSGLEPPKIHQNLMQKHIQK